MRNLSFFQKVLLAGLPSLIFSFIASYFVYNVVAHKSSDAERAIGMVNIVTRQELAMVRMSEHLRGYLLDPDDKEEIKLKLEADEEYGKLAGELTPLVTDSKEITALNEEMAKFDETTLDEVEKKVAALVDKKDAGAVAYFAKEYKPQREKQNVNFDRLKKMVREHSEGLIQGLETEKVRNAKIVCAALVATVLFGLLLTGWVSRRSIFQAERSIADADGVSVDVERMSGDLLGVSEKLNEAVAEQAAALQETAATLEEINAMVNRNNESVQQARTTSGENLRLVGDSSREIGLLRDTMLGIQQGNEKLVEDVEKNQKELDRISQQFQQIEAQTRIIYDIVFQTKLLSFNASVEAARAGEHGKGFAVVAEEVGNLAQMSGKAAAQIGDILQQSSKIITEVVEISRRRVEQVVGESRSRMDAGMSQMEKASETLAGVQGSVARVDKMLDEIRVASQEQSKGVQEINQAMSQLDSVSQANSSIATQAKDSSLGLKDRANRLASTIDQLIRIFRGENAGARAENVVSLDARRNENRAA